MADSMDLVQQRVEEERQRHIHTARNRTPGVSRVLCIDCDAPIPPARRRAIPGVQCCITCQEIAELKGKHYIGGCMSTILKWAGNKTAIMPELIKHLPAGLRLVEPFAGSCAVMMATDYPHYLVADINPDLINLYLMIQKDHEAVIQIAKELFKNFNSDVQYYRVRQHFNYSISNEVEKAAYFLYLNRHGYRGLCRYNQKGNITIHTDIIKAVLP